MEEGGEGKEGEEEEDDEGEEVETKWWKQIQGLRAD